MKTLMKTLITIGVLAFGSAATAVTVNAISIAPGGGDILCSETNTVLGNTITRCWDGSGTTSPKAFDAGDVARETGYDLILVDADGDGVADDPAPALSLLYKSGYGEMVNGVFVTPADSGTYANNYSTRFTGDPNNALISSAVTGDMLIGDSDIFPIEDRLINDIATCSVCFLYVKDGRNDPIWYIFDISTWNGTDNLNLTDFWPAGVDEDGKPLGGAISHVAIYGVEGNKGLIPPVPVPAAVWLFGSGLIGLIAIGRRKV